MKKNQKQIIQLALLIGLCLILMAIITWGNYRYCQDNPGGNDFLVHWMGTRSLLTDGISPYSDEVAIRIQTFAYGRPAQNGEHELRVAYPLYSIALFGPFALISDYTLARAIWMTILEAGLILLSVLGLKLTQWKPGLITLALLMIFSLFWYHGLRPLINGNAVILVAVMVTGALVAVKYGQDELAGVLLGLSTIKPQVVILIVAYICMWCALNQRWKLVSWFLVTVGLLTATTALIIPDWIFQNLNEVLRYPGYNPPGSPGAVFALYWPAWGERVGWALTGLLALLLLAEWILSIREGVRGFTWTACLTLVVSQWIGIQTDPGNFVVLMAPLILIFAMWEERWRKGGQVFSLLGMIGLMAGLWWMFLSTLKVDYQAQQSPLMFFPLPGLLLLGLYWVRWWAVRPPAVWFDLYRDGM